VDARSAMIILTGIAISVIMNGAEQNMKGCSNNYEKI
jgi:hypothetical protein